jgi:hypothetical protein
MKNAVQIKEFLYYFPDRHIGFSVADVGQIKVIAF